MSIYTKFGDQGNTRLLGNVVVPKSDPRVEAVGAVDELNSVLGVVIAFSDERTLHDSLLAIQRDLFILGAEIASREAEMQIKPKRILDLEAEIDAMETKLPRLTNFILPGGSKTASLLHHARTVCRRAERIVVSLSEKEKLNSDVLVYLNRLGDLLFIHARFVNHHLKKEEIVWKS